MLAFTLWFPNNKPRFDCLTKETKKPCTHAPHEGMYTRITVVPYKEHQLISHPTNNNWSWGTSYGGHSVGETPGPIPNPEAKTHSADGTAFVRMWESRTPPDNT